MEKRKTFFCDRSCHSGFFKGPGNPMKNSISQEKASKSAQEKFKRPGVKEALADAVRKKWAAGGYDGVRVGQCEWYELVLSDGRRMKLQGSWEFAFAKWMDEQGIRFEAHSGIIPYIDDDGVQRSYHPDFRLDEKSFIDVKNPYYEIKHARKLQLVCEQNDVKIEVVNRIRMDELGLLAGAQPTDAYSPWSNCR